MKQIGIIIAAIILTMVAIILLDVCLAGISAPSYESLFFGTFGALITLVVWYKLIIWLISKFK
jgi:hypothetical protein